MINILRLARDKAEKLYRYKPSNFEELLQLGIQMNEYINAPLEKLSSFVESKTDTLRLYKELQRININIIEEQINIENFKKWMGNFPRLMEYYSSQGDVKIEKLLEHFFVFEYLNLKMDDIYIDIASAKELSKNKMNI